MKNQNASHSKENLDTLARRCQELEACIAGDHTNLVALLRVGQAKAERERDTMRAEVERAGAHHPPLGAHIHRLR